MTKTEFEKAIKKLNKKEKKLYDEVYEKIEKERAGIFIKYLRAGRDGDYIVFYPEYVKLRNKKEYQTKYSYPVILNTTNIIRIDSYTFAAELVSIYFNEKCKEELLAQNISPGFLNEYTSFTASGLPEDYYFFETLEAAKLFIEVSK